MTRRSTMAARTARMLLVLVLAHAPAWLGGCTTVKMTGSARTGTEQLLLTGAWDDALCRVNFTPLAGAKVFLDGQFVNNADKEWVLASIRRTMMEQGVLIVNDKDKGKPDVIVEPSFGAWGTDQQTSTAGLPGVGLGASLTGPALTTSSGSSLNVSQVNRQDAVVKASLIAYDAKTGRLVWESGTFLNTQGVRDHFIFGHGPYRMSSRGEVEQYPDEAQAQTRKHFFRRYFGNVVPSGASD